MIFFQRFFAVYYLFLIRLRRIKTLRHLNRGGTEDFGAMIFLMISLFYFLGLLFLLIKKISHLDLSNLSKDDMIIIKVTVATLALIWIYFGYRYFISNRERRNGFIDNFRELKKSQKTIWSLSAFLLMLTPVWLLIYLIIRRHH